MGRIVTGVTLQTFPQAVREASLKPGQRFTLIVEDDTQSREDMLKEIDAIAEGVSSRMAADGIATEEQKDAFLDSLRDA